MIPGGVSAAAFTDLLLQAMTASKAAALLLDPGAEATALAWLQNDLMPRLVDRNFALMVKDQVELAATIGADGIHLTDPTQVAKVRNKFPDLSLGATCPAQRDDAMDAADLGADYIAIDLVAQADETGDNGAAGDDALSLIQWWAEMMTVPSVVFVITPEAARTAAQAGADFIAVPSSIWQQSDPLQAIQGFVSALT